MPELNKALFDEYNPRSPEEQRKLEKEFDADEEAVWDTLASRTDKQKKQISEAIHSLFLPIIDE